MTPRKHPIKRAAVLDNADIRAMRDRAQRHQHDTGTPCTAAVIHGADGKPHKAFIMAHMDGRVFALAVVETFKYNERDYEQPKLNRANQASISMLG